MSKNKFIIRIFVRSKIKKWTDRRMKEDDKPFVFVHDPADDEETMNDSQNM